MWAGKEVAGEEVMCWLGRRWLTTQRHRRAGQSGSQGAQTIGGLAAVQTSITRCGAVDYQIAVNDANPSIHR